jgi:hypothetical protein
VCRTEKEYVSDLRVLIDTYATPLRQPAFLSDEDHQRIFSHLDSILAFNRMLYCLSIDTRGACARWLCSADAARAGWRT